MAEGVCSLTQPDYCSSDSTISACLHSSSFATGLLIYHCLTRHTVVLLLAGSIQASFLSSLPWKLLLLPPAVAVRSFLRSLISFTLFPSLKVLTTWRLYFLAPKIPAKVLLLIYKNHLSSSDIFTLQIVLWITGGDHVQFLGD